ncbi:hypothetical protein JCM1840_003316 [Sporobolomyces johnsonii]
MKDHWGYDELLNLLEYIKVAGIDKRPTPADKEFRDAVRDLIKMVRDKIDPADWARFGAEHHDREGNRLPEGETVRLEDDAGQPYPFHNYQNAVLDAEETF